MLCCINSFQIFVCEAVTTSKAIPEKNKQWGEEGFEDISRGIEKIESETPRVNKKRSEISRHDLEKNSVEFPWVLVFGLGNSSGCEASFCLEFPRVK